LLPESSSRKPFCEKGGAFLESIQRYWKRTDKTYLLLCILSSSFAVLALSSWAAKQGSGFALDDVTGQIVGVGDYRRALVQAGAAAIGLCVAVLLSNIDYRSLVKVWPVHVAVTWGMVLPTLFIRNVTVGPLTIGYNAGDTDNYSWYKLGGFTLQPTELAKISFILTFAMHLNNVRGKINEPKELGKLLLHMLVPILIIHIQGDDGTAIIYGIIACCMMFSAGLSWKYIIGAISAAAAAVAVAFGFFSDKIGKGYQWYRILAVIDPENKTGWAPSETVWKNIIYQQQRGEIALGSGGIFGNGIFSGSYYSVPNAHNDFVFSWIGNVTGFVGCCVVLGILFALVCKTFATGARSEDMLGSFICAGIGGALMAQIAVNVGMNLRVLPVIGVTLPFYSAGGSSVLMLYICVGLVLSVYMHNTKKLFG
jgi:rod shape determining protein RodA